MKKVNKLFESDCVIGLGNPRRDLCLQARQTDLTVTAPCYRVKNVQPALGELPTSDVHRRKCCVQQPKKLSACTIVRPRPLADSHFGTVNYMILRFNTG